MSRAPGQRAWPALLILSVLWLCIYGPGLFRPALMDDADAAHADAGREILTRGDWVTLHENGIRYLEKAPLPFWAMAVAFKLFGVRAWTARLSLHLSVLIVAWFLYYFGRRYLSAQSGFWAGVVFLATIGPYLFTRLLIPDVTVGLWIGIAVYCFLEGWQSEKPSVLSCWAIAAVMGADVLTKGLIGVVFPCAIIFVFLLLARDLRHLRKMHLFSSALIFLLVAAPWHILSALRNPPAGQAKGFLWFFFINEQFLRYVGKRYPADYGTVPLLLFYGLLLLWFLPWSSFFPQALAQVRLRLPRTAGVRKSADAVLLLLFCWAAVILLFFSFSTRQEYYLAPTLPAFALLLGHWLAREEEAPIASPMAHSGRTSAAVLLVVGVLIAGTTTFLTLMSPSPQPGVEISSLLRRNPSVYVLSLGHFLDLTRDAMGLFRGPLIGTAIAFLLGPGLNWILRRRGKRAAANWILVAMIITFLECAHIALGVFYPVLGSQPLAAAIQSTLRPGEEIISDGEYAKVSSINFYTGKQMLIYKGRINGLWFGSLFPDAPPIFLEDAQLHELWARPQRIYFVTGNKAKKDLLEKIGPVYVLAESGGKFVLTNRQP
jgi:4-amino-4-deoxy-L-arabinose transferase-like glycosyltransferase